VKLALLGRAGADPRQLLRVQRSQLAPVADGLVGRVYATCGFDQVLASWRHESISATCGFSTPS
jgi:hypothetical protein